MSQTVKNRHPKHYKWVKYGCKSEEPKVGDDQTWMTPFEWSRLDLSDLQTPSSLKYLSKTFTQNVSYLSLCFSSTVFEKLTPVFP